MEERRGGANQLQESLDAGTTELSGARDQGRPERTGGGGVRDRSDQASGARSGAGDDEHDGAAQWASDGGGGSELSRADLHRGIAILGSDSAGGNSAGGGV